MGKAASNQLYRALVKISEEYFGPATERFLTAQIDHHLQKTPETITKQDMLKLADWLSLSLSAITSDTAAILEYGMAVRNLGRPQSKK